MAYTLNIPAADARMSDSYALIAGNFVEIATVFAVNHEALGTANSGKHKMMQFTARDLPLVPPDTIGDQWALYCQTQTYTSNISGAVSRPEIIVKSPNNATSFVLTSTPQCNDPLSSASGEERYPSGIIVTRRLQQETTNPPPGTIRTIDFPVDGDGNEIFDEVFTISISHSYVTDFAWANCNFYVYVINIDNVNKNYTLLYTQLNTAVGYSWPIFQVEIIGR